MKRSIQFETMPKPNIFSFDAIGTRWWCEDLSDKPILKALQRQLTETAERFNQDYSRFINSSYVSRLNRGEVITNPPAELVEMLQLCRLWFKQSDGYFNITVGGALHDAGYGSRSYAAPVWQQPWDEITLMPQQVVLPPKMTIDFGGFGKGWLIDVFVKLCRQAGMTDFIINGGGDLYVSSNQPVSIHLEHPYEEKMSVGQTKLMNQALAVSANTKRTWEHNGKIYGHLVNPKQQTPSYVASVYVKARSALIADVCATMLFLRPQLEVQLKKQYQLQTIILRNDQLKN
jgi:thiamine biosynthesis lipoprotein